MVELPSDLARLGDDFARATRRATARRERRRRIAAAALAGAAAFIAFTPAALDPAERTLTFVDASPRYAEPGCDHPRGARFTMAACEGPMVLHRPYAIQ
jgi:hypothetical protein